MSSVAKPIAEVLAGSEAWARFSKIVLELTGMPTALFTPGGELLSGRYKPEDMNPICQLIQAVPAGYTACMECNRSQFAEVARTRKPSRYRCHAGLWDIALPVFDEGSIVAVISTGQLLPSPTGGFDAFRPCCSRFGISVEALREAYYHAPYLSDAKIASVISLLTFFAEHLCEMSRRIQELTDERHPEIVRRALALVLSRLPDDLSLSKVALELDYSPGHLGRAFRLATGVPFSDYVRDLRIRKAKHELTGTRTHIADVAIACGFGSLSHFNRSFAKAAGCTPREYRKRAGLNGF